MAYFKRAVNAAFGFYTAYFDYIDCIAERIANKLLRISK